MKKISTTYAINTSRTSTFRRRSGGTRFSTARNTGTLPSGSMINQSVMTAERMSIRTESHKCNDCDYRSGVPVNRGGSTSTEAAAREGPSPGAARSERRIRRGGLQAVSDDRKTEIRRGDETGE